MQNDMIIHNTNDANKKHIYSQYLKRFEKYFDDSQYSSINDNYKLIRISKRNIEFFQ